MSSSVEKAVTFIEAVKESVAGATRYNSGDSVPSAAVLWTDADGEWRPIAKRLCGLVPELLTLGDYDPEQQTRPTIWMRCVVDGALPLPAPLTPISINLAFAKDSTNLRQLHGAFGPPLAQ